jgi:pantoate--beta-alanine ligase
MILFKKAADLHKYVDEQRKKGVKIAFVPTMGALHAGHIHLVKKAQQSQTITVCSIFVNPVQFNDPDDFAKYPVTLEKDILLLESVQCDILFLPSVEEIYPTGTTHLSRYDLGNLEKVLEGKYRPGHFQGVCAVVHRLLEIVMPDILYLGQKDYQQCLVIKKLIADAGLDSSIVLSIVPTQRENDGLAMSSRNMRLDSDNRKKAPAIYQSLLYIK